MADTAEKVFKDGLTPFNWFQKDNKLKFKVPVYQRLFAWDTPQFDRLLSDLQEWKKKNDEGPYYLGIITVVKQGDSFILIDGQQRLTVIAILFGMFKEFLKTNEINNLIDIDEISIVDYLDYEARPDDRKALETIWKNGSGWLVKCKNKDELNEIMEKNRIVSDSMRSFIRHIYEEYKKGKEDEWKNVIENNLLNQLKLLVSRLPDNYEKGLELQNEYFEKMNSAGKQLEPHEILKVRICEKEIEHNQWNSVENFTKKFNDPSNEIHFEYSLCNVLGGTRIGVKSISIAGSIITFSDEKKRTSIEKWRPALIDFPMFLLHVLHFLDESDLPSDSHSLLKRFDGKVKDDETKRRFVDAMREYRKFLDEWVIHKDVDSCEQEVIDNELNWDVSKYSYWSRKVNSMEIKLIRSDEDKQKKTEDAKNRKQDSSEQQVDSKEQSLNPSGNKTIEDVSKELKQIQMALSAVGGQNQEWMIEAFSYFENKEKDPSLLLNYHVRQLVSQFVNKDNEDFFAEREDAEWPDNFMTYDDKVPHAIFVCLDYFLWLLARTKETSPDPTGKLRDDVFTMKDGNWKTVEDYLKEGSNDSEAITCFIPKAHRSVEHFHPQTDNNSKPEIVSAWKDNKDMFGNLALISAGRNSEYGNYSVAEKAARINKLVNKKNLESIKLYLMMKECNEKDEEWTPDRAHRHANKMLEVLKWGIRHYGINIENIMAPYDKTESTPSSPC